MITDLNQTINLMNSEDYKDRFKAEYWQTKIRRDKLEKTIVKLDAGTMALPSSCSAELLLQQKMCMDMYLHVLAVRAEQDNIDL